MLSNALFNVSFRPRISKVTTPMEPERGEFCCAGSLETRVGTEQEKLIRATYWKLKLVQHQKVASESIKFILVRVRENHALPKSVIKFMVKSAMSSE